MKNFFQKTSTMLAFLLAIAATTQAATEKLRIMTFNIPYGNIKESDGNGQNSWGNRAKALHHYIDSVSPDLLGIQEGVKAELTSILAGTPGYAMVGCARTDGAELGEYTPILYKTSRFLLEKSGNYWLTGTPDRPSMTDGAICIRIATWALFTDKATGARFIYTNTHLDHSNDKVRTSQAKVVKEKMDSLATLFGKKLPQFLTADFNMKRTSSVYNYLLKYKLTTKDMWVSARKRAEKGVDGFSSTPDNEIDFIFAYGSVSCSYAELGNRWTPDGFIMSDHNPVFADVSWTTSVNDNARAAASEARAAADSTFSWKSSRTKLITSAGQFSTDGIDSTTSLRSIIDRNTGTYVRSRYSTPLPPNRPHYLQVALDSPQAAFSLQYYKSMDGDAGQDDRWDDVLVYASQDGEQWDYVTELSGFSGVQNKTYTANIHMRRPYRHVRFQIMRTPGMLLSNGAPRYSLSELQMYALEPLATCDYAKSGAVAKAVDAIYAQADSIQALANEGAATADDVASLVQATQDLRQARHDLASPIESMVQETAAANTRIYTPDGMRLTTPRKGMNILLRPGGAVTKVMVK